MATTVKYKGNTLTTATNETKILKTAGKYMEDDVTIEDVTSGGSASKKQINFIDYDGAILHSYTKTEWQSVSTLPSNPSHTGLTAQGWNWTKAQIDAQLTAVPDGDIWVGQMYITSSGDTEIDVSMPYGRLSPILTICVNGTITVDWGDNTTADTVTDSSLTTRKEVSHTYASAGNYTIVIHVVSGSFQFYGSGNYLILRKNTSGAQSRVYSNCVKNVRFGNGVTSIGSYAFYYCYSLTSITIPSEVTSIGSYAFYYCYSLASITIPSGVTVIAGNTFYYCCSLARITIPSGVTSIASNAFNGCNGMAEYHVLPTDVPTLGSTVFNNNATDCVIYVPSTKLTDYQSATNWSNYASYMVGE